MVGEEDGKEVAFTAASLPPALDDDDNVDTASRRQRIAVILVIKDSPNPDP